MAGGLHRAPGRARSSVLACVAAGEIVAAVVALALIGTSAGGAPVHGVDAVARTRPAAPRPPASDPLDAATVAWVVRALPSSARVLADPGVAALLAAHGFAPLTPAALRGPVAFVVASDRLLAAAGENPDVARALRTSQPVAVLRAAGRSVTVREVTSRTAAQLAGAAATRTRAERELLANPRVHANPSAAATLSHGGLDLRAATVLALAAAGQPLQVLDVPADPAETAAGRPARVVDVRAGARPQLLALLHAVDPQYRLASVTTRPDGTLRLTWPVAVG